MKIVHTPFDGGEECNIWGSMYQYLVLIIGCIKFSLHTYEICKECKMMIVDCIKSQTYCASRFDGTFFTLDFATPPKLTIAPTGHCVSSLSWSTTTAQSVTTVISIWCGGTNPSSSSKWSERFIPLTVIWRWVHVDQIVVCRLLGINRHWMTFSWPLEE